MRAPSAKQPGPVYERRTAQRVEHVRHPAGRQDIYQASAPKFGDYALVQLKNAPKAAAAAEG